MNTLLVDSVQRIRILISTGKLTVQTKKFKRKQCAWDIRYFLCSCVHRLNIAANCKKVEFPTMIPSSNHNKNLF
jgi:hypothetical protein